MQPRAIGVSEFCRLFGLGRTKAYELINAGVLTRVKVGRRSLITMESADRLLGPPAGEVSDGRP